MFVFVLVYYLPCTYMHARYSGDGDAADTLPRPTDRSVSRQTTETTATTLFG